MAACGSTLGTVWRFSKCNESRYTRFRRCLHWTGAKCACASSTVTTGGWHVEALGPELAVLLAIVEVLDQSIVVVSPEALERVLSSVDATQEPARPKQTATVGREGWPAQLIQGTHE